MITGEQGARKPASPVREETDGKGPGQGHLVGGPLHAAGGPGKPTRSNPGRAPRSDPTGRSSTGQPSRLRPRTCRLVRGFSCGTSPQPRARTCGVGFCGDATARKAIASEDAGDTPGWIPTPWTALTAPGRQLAHRLLQTRHGDSHRSNRRTVAFLAVGHRSPIWAVAAHRAPSRGTGGACIAHRQQSGAVR